MNEPEKIAVTVAEVARMVGLSRARFYQLIDAGIFPPPERDSETGRPFYGKELQQVCLDVRRRNCGVNGKPILFYARRLPTSTTPAKPPKMTAKPTPQADPLAHGLDAVKSLGLMTATLTGVTEAVKELFPGGIEGVEEGEVIRKVFLRLKNPKKE